MNVEYLGRLCVLVSQRSDTVEQILGIKPSSQVKTQLQAVTEVFLFWVF